MKTINYTGSSKLIARIVNLLNRKAPLPLDGDGDPDWGTNGQFLTTDGAGGTAWSSGGGGGDTVSWTQDVTTGTKIASIDINGNSTDVYAPSGGSGDTVSWTQITTTGTKIAEIDINGTSTNVYAPTGGGSTYTEGDGIDINSSNVISVDTTFTEAGTRVNIASGDTFSTILGKIKKFFTDLKTVAFTGSYTDLSNQPTIPTNNNQLTNGAGYITSSGSCASATKATQDADGYDIRNKYVNIYNSWDIGRLTSVTVNDLANQGSAVAMINAATNNPLGGAKWVHVWSQAWRKGVNTSWVSQIALGVENSNGMWYRTGSGTIVDRAWKRVIDGSNLDSSVAVLGYLKAPNMSEYEIASSASSSHKLTMSGYSAYGAADILISTRYSFGVIKITSDANNALSASMSMLIGASSISIAQSSAGVFTLAHGAWCAVTMVVFHKEWGGFTIAIS